MSSSILFSQDMIPIYNNAQKQTPHLLHLATPKTTTVEHWLSQQNAQRSNAQQQSYIMSTYGNSFTNHANEDLQGYTITTEQDDVFSQWTNANPQYESGLGLHLDTHPMAQLPTPSSPHWAEFSYGDNSSSAPGYLLTPSYSPDSNTHMSPFTMSAGSLPQASPIGSELSLSPSYPVSPRLPSPSSPGSCMPSPSPSDMNNMLLLDTQTPPNDKALFTHREQLGKFRDVLRLPLDGAGPFVPQPMYKPHTTSDRKRYVEEVLLEAPLFFISEHAQQYGIPLKDALHFRTKKLRDRDQVVFEGRGPSVSIRLEWPGYRQWSRQIPTKDFRSPPQPITLAKLAKNVAKCVQRFMADRKGAPQEEDADPRWRIGDGPNDVKLDDLVLVSIHHVSLGSWQPQLRLMRPRASPPQVHRQVLSHGQGHSHGHVHGHGQLALPPTPMSAIGASPMAFGRHM
ncbi:hypothetical protein HYPSUDRAFT_34526 [Hypholoma sublateritium FD-334 SS-4]|uniref:Uncharacterized protein n=1 Tax=Hypholoma sublateritium (strain FD-334 SS-4) TaxID=945553 RepID=A0A0D2MW26_HYPSF|nr:hypothetical protein HYPSUDRAFT_34526 [Hypholoma sublateritium FD-334 SS-4]